MNSGLSSKKTSSCKCNCLLKKGYINYLKQVCTVLINKVFQLWIQPNKKSCVKILAIDRQLPSSKNPHFQNEAKCTTFLVKMSFICMRMAIISISKAEYLTSF